MYQLNLVKGRENKDEITNTHRILEKEREFQKNIYFCYTDYTKAFDCVDQNQLWNILNEIGMPDNITFLLLSHVQFCYFLTCIQVSQATGKVVWYSHLFKNFPQFVVIHTVKGFSMVNEAEVDVFFGTHLFSL